MLSRSLFRFSLSSRSTFQAASVRSLTTITDRERVSARQRQQKNLVFL